MGDVWHLLIPCQVIGEIWKMFLVDLLLTAVDPVKCSQTGVGTLYESVLMQVYDLLVIRFIRFHDKRLIGKYVVWFLRIYLCEYY